MLQYSNLSFLSEDGNIFVSLHSTFSIYCLYFSNQVYDKIQFTMVRDVPGI